MKTINSISIGLLMIASMLLSACGLIRTTPNPNDSTPAPQSVVPTATPAPAPSEVASPSPFVPTEVVLTPITTQPSAESLSWVISPQNAADVIQLARLGGGMINSAPFFSADGRMLLIPTTIGVDLYDATSLQRIGFIPALYDGDVTLMTPYPRLVALSPDGRLLAANLYTYRFSQEGVFQEESYGQMTIYLWNVTDGTLARKIPVGSERYILDLAFSPDNGTLAAGFDDGKVQLWRLTDGQELYTVKGYRLAFSPDGSRLVTMPPDYGEERQVYVYDAASGDLLRQWEGQRAIFSPEGRLAIEGDDAVRLMDIEKGTALQAFNGKSAAFSADGRLLAMLDRGRVRLYQAADGSLVQTLEGDFESAYSLQLSPDGSTLAIAGEVPACPNCQTIPEAAVWQLSDGKRIPIDIADPRWITYAPQSGDLLLWTAGSLYILNPRDASTIKAFDEYATSVDGIAFAPNGQTLAADSGQPHLTARLWNVTDGLIEKMFEDPANPGYGNGQVLFSPDGQVLAAQGRFWRSTDGERLGQLVDILAKEGPPYVPSSMVYSPDGNILAMGYLEGVLQLWDLKKERLVRKLEGFSGEVVSLSFSPDGKTLAAVFAYPDYTVQLWKIPEGERLLNIKGASPANVFSKVVFSPDGETLATIATDNDRMDTGIVELWRASDGQRLLQLGTKGVFSLAISPDGLLLATGSYDHQVRLWQATDGVLLNTLRDNAGGITDLVFSPSGEILASGSSDGTVVLWGLPKAP